jgi:hypothetical protein
MPNAQLKLGNNIVINLNASSDLSSLAGSPVKLAVAGSQLTFDSLLTRPISEVSQFSLQAQITLDASGSWKVAGQAQPLTLSIDAGASGSLTLIQPGAQLFQFPNNADGSAGQVQKAQNGGKDCPYLKLSFNVKYSVQAGAQFSFGALGVKAGANGGQGLTVDNYIACDSSTTLADAIVAAFNSFSMPFNAADAAAIPDGTFIDYVFLGNIAFNAGLNYGVSLGAASLAQIKTAFSSPLVSGGIAPSVKIGASLDVQFEADDAFRIIVGRQNSAAQNVINLCVSKADKSKLGVTVGANLSASLRAKFNLQDTLNNILEKAAGPAVANLTGSDRQKALDLFKKTLTNDAMDQYVKEAQSKIDSFLNKVNNEKAAFTAAYERDRNKTQLFNYVVNCGVPAALNDGYSAAINCDFATAMHVPGVDLQPGSFLEDELTRTMTITLQFFNIFTATDAVEFFRKLKTLYAGGGVFRIIFDTGVDWKSVFNGRSEDLKVFFEATAATPDETTFENAVITLNFFMGDTNDAEKAALTAKTLRLLNSVQLSELANRITDTVQVTAKITPDAFKDLRFDPVEIGGHLNSGSHDNDRRNYEVFVANVDALRPDDPFGQGRLNSYADWVTFNTRVNDQENSTHPPDRAHSGNLQIWPEKFSSIDPAARPFIAIDFEAGRQFMNLCEFVDRLDDETLTEKMTADYFSKVLDALDSAIQNSSTVLTWYSKACFSALAQLMSARVTNVKGPASPNDPDNISFELEHQTAVSAAGARR